MEKTKEPKEELQVLYDDILYVTSEERAILIDALALRLSRKVDVMKMGLSVTHEDAEKMSLVVQRFIDEISETADLLKGLTADTDDDCDGDCEHCPYGTDEEGKDESDG